MVIVNGLGVPGMSCARNASAWRVLIMLNPNRVTPFYRLGVGKQNGDACDMAVRVGIDAEYPSNSHRRR